MVFQAVSQEVADLLKTFCDLAQSMLGLGQLVFQLAVQQRVVSPQFLQADNSGVHHGLHVQQPGHTVVDALHNFREEIRARIENLVAATETDWSTEYLDAIISVMLVDGISGAIEHINRWSSAHTEAVIAEDQAVAERFFTEIDSAILLHNASTQFADGGEFGMGGEIGIATGKMHARGPVGVEQLTSFKYRVRGTGQVRP